MPDLSSIILTLLNIFYQNQTKVLNKNS